MKTKILIHKLNNYLITNTPISRQGQYCAICDKEQPFNNWNCLICDGNSLAGEPFDDEIENFDKEFESLQEEVITLKCKTKRNSYIYQYTLS